MNEKCIDEEQMMDYLARRLSKDEIKRVEHHLALCDRCLEELVVIQRVVTAASHEDVRIPGQTSLSVQPDTSVWKIGNLPLFTRMAHGLVSKMNRFIESLNRLRAVNPNNLAAVRGCRSDSPDVVQVNKKFFDLEVEICMEKIESDSALIQVLLLADDLDLNPARVSLVNDQRELLSFLLNGSVVSFENISQGSYVLKFSRNGRHLGEYPLTIRESG